LPINVSPNSRHPNQQKMTGNTSRWVRFPTRASE
jgi:hypothetical protein